MYVGLFLVFWIALGIALVLWVHVRLAPRTDGRPRRRRGHQQAVAVPDWSRRVPSRAH